MNLITKVFSGGALILFGLTTMQTMTASNQFESADLVQLNKIMLINETMNEQEINMASFMNNQVSLVECKQIFKENNFNHFNYEACSEFVEDLHISSLDKKQANEPITEKNSLPSVI
jgi:G3E family GTPase